MIRTEGVQKTYYTGGIRIEALPERSIEVPRQSCLLLQGASGCGKTTLLSIIGCLIKPTNGRVWLDGKEISQLPEHFLSTIRRERIGFIFQQFNLLSGYTVLQNVTVPLLPIGMGTASREKLGHQLLKRLQLDTRAHSDINELSGGQQQRVAVARALINNPDIILADEPTSNIDQENAQVLLEIFAELKKAGKTLVLSSHDSYIMESGIADAVCQF